MSKRLRISYKIFLCWVSLVGWIVPRTSLALSDDVRTVMVAATYGAAAGTAAGLVSFPVSGEARNIVIGTSLGLYLGIIAGVYHMTHRYDPENPFQEPLPPVPPGERAPLQDDLKRGAQGILPLIYVQAPVIRF